MGLGWNSVPDPRSAAHPCVPRATSLTALSLLATRNTDRKQHTPDRGLIRVVHGFVIQRRFSARYLTTSYSCRSTSSCGSIKFSETFSSVQSLSRVQLFATPWTAAHQTSMSITNSQSLLKLMPIESVMPSNHLILCRPLLLLPSIFPSIRVFSNESLLHIRWPKYWSFSFSISPSNEHPGLISFRMD